MLSKSIRPSRTIDQRWIEMAYFAWLLYYSGTFYRSLFAGYCKSPVLTNNESSKLIHKQAAFSRILTFNCLCRFLFHAKIVSVRKPWLVPEISPLPTMSLPSKASSQNSVDTDTFSLTKRLSKEFGDIDSISSSKRSSKDYGVDTDFNYSTKRLYTKDNGSSTLSRRSSISGYTSLSRRPSESAGQLNLSRRPSFNESPVGTLIRKRRVSETRSPGKEQGNC
jgi:hypothetical protein